LESEKWVPQQYKIIRAKGNTVSLQRSHEEENSLNRVLQMLACITRIRKKARGGGPTVSDGIVRPDIGRGK